MGSPESEFDFESIVWTSFTEEERERLSDMFEKAERKPPRKGPGLLRNSSMFGDSLPGGPGDPGDALGDEELDDDAWDGGLFCQACGGHITGPYWATKLGPFHPACFDG